MAVNLDACIQCNRCVRACREEQVNDVIGYAMRGSHSEIVFDLNDPMGDSTCVACGECVQACPTGALMPKGLIGSQTVDRKVDSVCPFCGVGCQITYNVKDEKIEPAKEIWASLDNEQKTALWSLLDSRTRSTFKKA
jgi:formate dehydrogenase major subunit